MSTGHNHSIVLHNDYSISLFGDNSNYQLGLSHNNQVHSVVTLKDFPASYVLA